MLTVAAALLLAATGSGPAGSDLLPGDCSPLHSADPVAAMLAEAGHADDMHALAALFAQTPSVFPSRGLPAPVRAAFARPFALPDLARRATDPAADAGDRPFRAVAQLAAHAYGIPSGAVEERSTLEVSDPQRALFALDFLLNESNLAVKEALAAAGMPEDRTPVVRAATSRAVETVGGGRPTHEPLAVAMRLALAIDRAALVRAALHFDARLDVTGDWTAHAPEELPQELAGAVEGTVLTTQLIPELGWLVVGGPGDNRYDMTRIAGVLDPSGNDRYDWGAGTLGSRLVVDVAGNDAHRGTAFPDGSAPTCGAAGAACGVSVIDDWQGDDTYQGTRVALGAATFGVGILVDRAGNDRYEGGQWTQASAFGGIGALCDLAGDDLYDAEAFSQACGGPGGAALLLDAAGNDRYRADRGVPSVYGTPGVFLSASQGVGFGYRAGAAGGVGALVDLAGNDRYEAGEFAQGCGYYLSMGVLRDDAGRDLYYGNRFAQGCGVHQAFGAMLEGGGDDIYWSMSAAGQGAAWDQGVGVLLDRAGDDRYQADGLSQGAAAQQAVGLLLDLGGDDDYRAGSAAQGAGDGNRYHWERSRCGSLGVLRDDGGRNRWTAEGRTDGRGMVTGKADEPEARTQWGVFLSR